MSIAIGSQRPKKYDQIIGVDFGRRTTKAISIKRRGEVFEFSNYAIVDTPVFEKNLTAEPLAEHLKSVIKKLDTKAKRINMAIGSADSIVRIVDLPAMAVANMRLMLKHSSKTYLQQELSDYVFDCFILPPGKIMPKQSEEERKTTAQKYRVVVGGAKQQLIDEIQKAAKAARITIDNLIPGLICPVNSFEYAQPDVFKNESVALVDLGFKGSSISVLVQGEIALNRVVNIGGDNLTSGLAEALGITYTEAEGIKVGMPEEVQAHLEPIITTLGRELRASIDFCEHQYNVTVGQVFISGSAARSDFLLKCLQNELIVPCHRWNPAAFMKYELPPQLIADVEQVAPQLAVAIGAAVCSF
ncbi:MAG TPA: pilus assembly protein PilM [Verrucomicrobiota bacterium]|nr:pilus assembly protein PilM [Verrucomicrobiota bacterium]